MLKRDNSDVRPIPISRSQATNYHGASHFYPTRSSFPDCSTDQHSRGHWSKLSPQDRSGEMLDLTAMPQEIDVSYARRNSVMVLYVL